MQLLWLYLGGLTAANDEDHQLVRPAEVPAAAARPVRRTLLGQDQRVRHQPSRAHEDGCQARDGGEEVPDGSQHELQVRFLNMRSEVKLAVDTPA